MMRPEQRQAVEMFRAFRDYAAAADWDNRQAFDQLSQEYENVSRAMLDALEKAAQRRSALETRRMALMQRSGKPYIPVAL